MRKDHAYILLICLFAVTLTIRLYFAFSSPYFRDDESYFHLRHVEAIQENILPLFYDPLSFSGMLFVFSPLFHYIFALLTSFGSTWYITKIIPNLFATSLLVIIFVLVEEITHNKQIALFSASISAFIPVYFVETVNSLSPRALCLFLFLSYSYFFYKIQEKKYATLSTVLLCILILLDPSVFLLIFGLLAYLFLELIYGITPKTEEKELILFSLLLCCWYYLLLYKRSLLEHGAGILWQNIPPQLVDKYYYDFTIISSISHIGIVPLIFGLLVVYYTLFKDPSKNKFATSLDIAIFSEQRKKILPVVGIALVTSVLLVFKIVEWTIGLLYLSILLVLLSGYGYMLFHMYIQKTKVRGWSHLLFSIVFLIFIISSVYPTIIYTTEKLSLTITPKEVVFLPEITLPDVVVLSLVDDGHYIEYFGERRTVVDSNFLQIKDARQRLRDIDTLFTTQSKTVATKIMNKYNATYIYISPTAKKLYDIEFLPYEDNDCFRLVYTGEVRLYESTCEQKEHFEPMKDKAKDINKRT